jgi:hypothetical protein
MTEVLVEEELNVELDSLKEKFDELIEFRKKHKDDIVKRINQYSNSYFCNYQIEGDYDNEKIMFNFPNYACFAYCLTSTYIAKSKYYQPFAKHCKNFKMAITIPKVYNLKKYLPESVIKKYSNEEYNLLQYQNLIDILTNLDLTYLLEENNEYWSLYVDFTDINFNYIKFCLYMIRSNYESYMMNNVIIENNKFKSNDYLNILNDYKNEYPNVHLFSLILILRFGLAACYYGHRIMVYESFDFTNAKMNSFIDNLVNNKVEGSYLDQHIDDHFRRSPNSRSDYFYKTRHDYKSSQYIVDIDFDKIEKKLKQYENLCNR